MLCPRRFILVESVHMWATTAADTLPAAAVREPTLLFVTERGLNLDQEQIRMLPLKPATTDYFQTLPFNQNADFV